MPTPFQPRPAWFSICLLCLVASVATAQEDVPVKPGNDSDNPNQVTVPAGQRPPRPPQPGGQAAPTRFPDVLRSIDGTDNNRDHGNWGATNIPLLRAMPADYADGRQAPAGSHRKSAREVSNLVMDQETSRPNRRGASDLFWQWGQFLDHDIDLTPGASPAELLPIAVPAGDPWFDPDGTGNVTIPFNRSGYVSGQGVRQQMNLITAFIDASNVYGSDPARAAQLRTHDGTGRLETSPGNLLPHNTTGQANAPSSSNAFFLAGDVRANEQVGLTAMHTLFVREHNRLAAQIRRDNPQLDGEAIYQTARALVVAEMQAITYREYLPLLLGPGALGPYEGYDPSVDPSISNVFATAAYRFGHTMLSPHIYRLDAQGQEIPAGHLSLAEAFFSPARLVESGIGPVLRGLASHRAEEIDIFVVDEVRNFLFGPPGSAGLDLASLNIQRGRDHGLPSYNQARRDLGLPSFDRIGEISPDPAVRRRLARAYDTVEDVDLWVGALAERPVPGAMVGEVCRGILVDQFRRLRSGDRFWYERYLPPEMVELVEQQTLLRIIRRNTDIGAELSGNPFLSPDRN